MQLDEAFLLGAEGHDGDARGEGARDLVEARDGEEHVLERVERKLLGRRARERLRGVVLRAEELRAVRETQVRRPLRF